MMKISKPVLGNEFLLSSVQFTSLNSIVFKNVKNVYEENEKIVLDYEHSSMIEASSRDWIGIFPRGWCTLQQYINFEWVSQSFPTGNSEQNKENADLIRRTVNFCPKYLGSVNKNSFYQFVYISKQIEVLGVSSYFRFDVANSSNRTLELECLVPVSAKLRSTSVSDFGILLGNNLPSSTSLDTRTLQTSSIHSLQNLDAENKNWAKAHTKLKTGDIKKPTIFPRKTAAKNDALDPCTSHSEPIFPMSFQMAHCKKCFHPKRGGEFLRSQQVLQSKLKIVMERNKVLEERTQEIKKEMERLQAESKKLKMSFYNANKEKVAYEKFVKDFIKSLEKDSIVRVVNGNTEILVKKVNYVGMEEHPRGKKTSKRERELKAVIGLQEITIRNLINSLQEKAKSVHELNQTVKLAQAFSSARNECRDYGSDAEEILDEVSNSDIASEYEFSLTKPQPPEEAEVEDTDAVLDGIRRATEMELKDIGINRSLGKSLSRDSQLELPNLSVHSFHNQTEGTRPKKPRLFDNLEDCWHFSENTPKTVHRKVLETTSPRAEDVEENVPDEPVNSGQENPTGDEDVGEKINEECESVLKESNDESTQEIVVENVEKKQKPGNSEEHANFDDYYDAYDSDSPVEKVEEPQNAAVVQDVSEDEKKEKQNFLVTAIIPQDMTIKADKPDDWVAINQEEPVEQKVEAPAVKGKKFTCELSIDFSSKVNQNQVQTNQPAIEDKKPEEDQNQICNQFAVIPADVEMKREKSLVTFKKSNKCLEIKITQMDQKDTGNKNVLHQKMVVKFGKDSQQVAGAQKPSKFEFNLALTGLGDNAKVLTPEIANDQKEEEEPESKVPEPTPTEIDVSSPRTVWNDATDELLEEDEAFLQESVPPPETVNDLDPPQVESPENDTEDDQCATTEPPKEESPETVDSMKSYEDSLRYEKNLEFLQQKTNDRSKEEDDGSKEKPSAILIQNGQTKLALIRYQ